MVIGILAARTACDRYVLTHPGEEYDVNLLAIIRDVIVPLAGVAGAAVGVMLVGLFRAPKVAFGWLLLSSGSLMVLAVLPIRAAHGWTIAIYDLLAGAILIGIGLKVAR